MELNSLIKINKSGKLFNKKSDLKIISESERAVIKGKKDTTESTSAKDPIIINIKR